MKQGRALRCISTRFRSSFNNNLSYSCTMCRSSSGIRTSKIQQYIYFIYYCLYYYKAKYLYNIYNFTKQFNVFLCANFVMMNKYYLNDHFNVLYNEKIQWVSLIFQAEVKQRKCLVGTMNFNRAVQSRLEQLNIEVEKNAL